jgi:outer membrane protein assembly factor BamB
MSLHRATLLTFALFAPLSAVAQQPGGTAPAIVNRPLSEIANQQAITARFWVPDLDAGFVPQGLAFQGGQVVLAGYTSTDKDQSRGPCTLIWMSPASGRVARRLALPSACGHAGGVAAISGGRLVVADTRALFIIVDGRVDSTVTLTGALRGSFADFDGRDLWLGSYERSGGMLWRIPLSALSKSTISQADAAETLPAPVNAQGMAFDRQGQMWVTSSSSRDGAIHKLDRRTGQILATYAAPAGLEDIAFDESGRLWTSSEAGSRRWSGWSTFFPLVFAVDINRLK